MAASALIETPGVDERVLTAYEVERNERIKQNRAVMASMGIFEQKTLFEAAFRIVKKPSGNTSKRRKITKEFGTTNSTRASSRLQGSQPEYKGLADDHRECCDGRIELPKDVQNRDAWSHIVQERRCDSQSRGSLYDSKAGITCHFCRQKKLCGEPDCSRCSTRDPSMPCIGKSECSRCASATGRFCRACLLIRYGCKLDEVKKEMDAGTWLCPHCYEEDHPEKGWICNSSICMTRRGLKPTGIAIFDAQQQGFLSVAHHVQAKLIQHRSRYTEETEPAESKAEAPNSEITTAIAISRSKKKGSNKPPKAAQREDGMLLAKPTAQRLTRLQHKEQNDEH